MNPSAFNKTSVHPGLNQPVSFHTSSMPALRTAPPTAYEKSLDEFLMADFTSPAEEARAQRNFIARIKSRYAAMTGIESDQITLTRQESGRHLFSATVNLNRIDGATFIGKCTIAGNMITDQFSQLNLIQAEEAKK